MEVVHLECFVTLADELHFGRTAARLHVGTPAVSKRIGELERRLGVRLFDRTSREVRLTPAGETLLDQAQQVLAEIGNLRTMAADAAAGVLGGIRAAYSPGTGELMNVLIRELRRRTPGLAVHPVQMLSVRVAAAVRSSAVAVGIARVPPGPGLGTMVLAESPLNAVAMPAAHPLARRDHLCPEDLANETLVGPSRSLSGGGRTGVSSARFREADVTSEGELFDLVSAGFGLCVTTEGIVRHNPRQDIVVRPLVGLDATAKELLLWRIDDDSPVVRAIRDVAKDVRPELNRIMRG
jgi:DNA-binding transcriptional LysR family regulator